MHIMYLFHRNSQSQLGILNACMAGEVVKYDCEQIWQWGILEWVNI